MTSHLHRTQSYRSSRFSPVPSVLISCAFIFSLTGCAGQKTTQTGFIPQNTYGQMVHQKDHTDDLVYVSPTIDASKYHFVVIDPVTWHPAAKAPKLKPEAEARMTKAFHDALVKALAHDFRVITPEECEPTCANTIRVRAAITNIRRSKWYYNALPIVAGFAAGAVGGGVPPIPPPFPGGASEELVATDATTGETLIAISTYNNGMPWNMMGQWLPYAHAKRAFRLASELMEEEFHKIKKNESTQVAFQNPS
ncbi:DUF3313 domain-containing protein [Gluconobacter thailandicus]|uniref:DUF3313 domain-containing protein n=2 Tax=Gluconobacter thailandicus TaxID=257438 RepID=A0AAP9JI83_GLUTH|nr:DUF3313 domain-containing protein [Gluconobacter thailandicus]